jgi:hypothetical protein
MTIKELEGGHLDLKWTQYKSDLEHAKDHTELFVKFTISKLEDLEYTDEIMLTIWELKKYLNEN